MMSMAKCLPQPYVMHVRFATVGGKGAELTHPFPLDDKASLDLRGDTDQGVLFHNGHQGHWNAKGTPDSPGPWSDSRLITWVHSRLRNDELVRELAATGAGKFVVLTPTRLYKVGDFCSIGDGLWASNLHWQRAAESAYVYSGLGQYDSPKKYKKHWTKPSPVAAPETENMLAKAANDAIDRANAKVVTSPRFLLPEYEAFAKQQDAADEEWAQQWMQSGET